MSPKLIIASLDWCFNIPASWRSSRPRNYNMLESCADHLQQLEYLNFRLWAPGSTTMWWRQLTQASFRERSSILCSTSLRLMIALKSLCATYKTPYSSPENVCECIRLYSSWPMSQTNIASGIYGITIRYTSIKLFPVYSITKSRDWIKTTQRYLPLRLRNYPQVTRLFGRQLGTDPTSYISKKRSVISMNCTGFITDTKTKWVAFVECYPADWLRSASRS
jgi:hypothetical protein